MNLTQFLALPTNLYGWIGLIVVVLGAYFFVRRSDVNGLRSANDDLRKRIDDKDQQLRDLQTEITALAAKVDKMQAILTEKDKRINALENVQIVQSPSPEVTAYMSDMRNFTTQVHLFMVESSKILGELNVKTSK